VPEDALREALLNAICHKQYQSGIPIQISVYEDRLYVANVGSLPENWTIESLMAKHSSVPYNPNIASVFYLAGFIESWGRGVEKICDALKADNLPMPEYTVHPGDIMIKFTGPEDRIVRVTDRLSDQLSEKLSDKLSDKEKLTLELLVEDPGYTSPQIADKLGVSRVSVTKYLKALKEKGLIERVGSDRKGYWKVNAQ
jgi:ATP-dependent DNA helicase RecG